MPDNKSPDIINWILSSYGVVISFMFGWLIRLQNTTNKVNKDLAVNYKQDEFRYQEIQEIKTSINQMSHKIDAVVLCVQDQKEMYNNALIENQKLRPLVQKQAKLIEELLG